MKCSQCDKKAVYKSVKPQALNSCVVEEGDTINLCEYHGFGMNVRPINSRKVVTDKWEN